MNRARLAPLLLLVATGAGCASPRPRMEQVAHKVLSVSEVRERDDGGLALRLAPIEEGTPPNLAVDLAAGYGWLLLDPPAGLESLGMPLATGRTILVPTHLGIDLSRVEGSDAHLRGKEAEIRALGRLRGPEFQSCVRAMPDPGWPAEGLETIRQREARVALGRGMDSACSLGSDQGWSMNRYDALEWVAVIDADDRRVDWRAALDEAVRRFDLEGLDHLDLVVSRFRPDGDPAERFFRLPLRNVVLLSQVRLKPQLSDGTASWHWAGRWSARFATGPGPGRPTRSLLANQVTILYREIRIR